MSPEGGVVLALLAALPVVMASGFTTYEALKGGVLLLGGGVLALMWLVRVLRGQPLELRGWLVLLPVLGLGVFALASALWAPASWVALESGARWLALAAVMAAILGGSPRPIRLGHAAVALSIGAGLASAVGLLQVCGVAIDTMAPSGPTDGLRGSFDDAKHAGLSLACALPLMAAGLWLVRHPAARALIGASMALTALCVGATGASLGWAFAAGGVLCGVAALGIGRGLGGLKALGRPLATLGVAAALVALGAIALDKPPKPRMAQVNGKLVEATDSSIDDGVIDERDRASLAVGAVDWGRTPAPKDWSAHEHALSTAWRTALASPVVGVGAGNWSNIQARNLDRASTWYNSHLLAFPIPHVAHSSFLQLAAELGFVGLLLFLMGLALIGAVALRALRVKEQGEPDVRWITGVFGLIATLDALVFSFALSASLELAFTALLFAVAAGLLCREALSKLDDKGAASPWVIDPARQGFGALERYGLAATPALVAATLALGLGVTWTMSDYYKARGDVWLRAGNLDEANAAYSAAIAVMPGNDLAVFNQSNLADVVRTQAEVEQLLMRGLELRPHDPRLYVALGQLQMREAARRGRDKWKKIEGELPPPEPGKPPAPKAPGGEKIDPSKLMEFVDREMMNRAVANFNLAKELHPRFILVYERLSNAYMVDKNIEKSQTELLLALEKIDGQDIRTASRLHSTLAQSYMADQDWPKARKHLDLALEIHPLTSRRDAILRDLAEVDARSKGKVIDKHDHGHGHGQGPPGLKRPPQLPPGQDPGGQRPDGQAPEGHGHEHDREQGEAPSDAPKAPSDVPRPPQEAPAAP